MALEWKESPWTEVYRAAERRRHGRLRRGLSRLAADLGEFFDAAIVLGVILGAAIVLAWAVPL
jgi:hypothetical protein